MTRDDSCYGTMMEQVPEEVRESLDELIREGARRMLVAALEAEVEEYISTHREERDEEGRALVVRNGHARERQLTTGAGVLAVRAPRVDDRREDQRFTSALLPPYMRKSPRLEEALPVLYLRGISTGDIGPALSVLLGGSASGLSATTITRLKEAWKDEYRLWRKRDLSETRYAYICADGVNFSVRLEEDNLKCLVIVGVTESGDKEIIALEEGYRESAESWKTLLRDLKRRGFLAPHLAVGDGALGFWSALGDLFPDVDQQLCWKHKLANVLDKLPKRLQGQAKAHLHEIMYAPDRATATAEAKTFEASYGAKYPKAVASLTDNLGRLLNFLDYPAEHWVHLRTTNPIESTFGTVKARTRRTRGAGSRAAGLAMAFKLIEAAEQRWRRVNAPLLVAAVLHGVQFKDGVRVTPSPSDSTADVDSEKVAA